MEIAWIPRPGVHQVASGPSSPRKRTKAKSGAADVQRKAISISLCAAMLLMVASPAPAAPVTFDFTGTVTTLEGSPISGFPVAPSLGDTIHGSYTFESTTPALSSISFPFFNSTFNDAIQKFNIAGFSIDDLVHSDLPRTSNYILVSVDFGDPNLDLYSVNENALTGDDKYWFFTSVIFWAQNLPGLGLPDPSDLALTFDGFIPPNAAYFGFDILDAHFLSLAPPIFHFGGVIDGITLAPAADEVIAAVPEPATLAILGLGLAGLGNMRRRRANEPSAVGDGASLQS